MSSTHILPTASSLSHRSTPTPPIGSDPTITAISANDPLSQVGIQSFGVFAQTKDTPEEPKSWDDCLITIDQWRHQPPSSASLSNLFYTLQSLGRPPTDFDITSLLTKTVPYLDRCDPETMAMIYYWSCKSNLATTEFLSTVAQSVQDRSMFGFHPKHLVLMIYGSSWLVRQKRAKSKSNPMDATSPSELYPGMMALVEAAAQEVTSPSKIVQMREQDLANSLYSFGILRYRNNAVIEPLLRRIEQPSLLPRFLEQELANMLLGMTGLRLIGHPTVAILAAEVIERERLRMYKEPELCSIFYSFALLGYSHPDVLEILMREAVRSGRMGVYRPHHLSNLLFAFDRLDIKDERVWRQLLNEITLPDRLKQFESHHMANILYAFGRCNYRDDAAVHQILKEVTQEERLRGYSTRELSLMLYGLSRTQHRHPASLKAFCEELCRPGRLKEPGLAPRALSGLMLSLATLKHTDAHLIDRFLTDVLHEDALREMDPDVVAQYVFCLGKFKMPFRGATKTVAMELLEAKGKLQTLTHRGLGMMIYGLGQMGPDVTSHLRPVVDHLHNAVGLIERFSVQDLAMLIYSFGLIRLEEFDLIDRMLQTFTRPDRIHAASTQHLSNVLYGLGLLKYPIKSIQLEMLEGELIRDVRVKCFTSQELSNLIYSIGLLGVDHRPAMQTVIEKLTMEAIQPERLAQFQEMELNCFLTGLSHLSYREPSILVPLLEEITHPHRLQRLKEKEIAGAVNVIGQLGVCPDELCEKLLTEACRQERMEKYDTTSLVMMIYSLGRLQNQNYPEALEAFSRAILRTPTVHKLGEQHLSNFFYGLAHARYDAPEVLKLIFEEMTKHHRLARYHGAEILNIMKSVLVLKNRNVRVEALDHVARIFAIEMTSVSRIPRYTPSQLTHVLAILGVLRNKNVATVFPILTELTKTEKLPQLTSIDVARAVAALGPMAFVNRKLHPQLALSVKPILKQAILGTGPAAMNCHSITELVIGMSMLGLHDTYLLDNLSNEIVKPARLRSFRAWHLSRIFYAVAQLRYNNLELLRGIAGELSRPDRAQRLDYRHWSNILSAVLMLKFKDEEFAKLIEKQIHTPAGKEDASSKLFV